MLNIVNVTIVVTFTLQCFFSNKADNIFSGQDTNFIQSGSHKIQDEQQFELMTQIHEQTQLELDHYYFEADKWELSIA